jgi:hypothetical protein
MNLTKRSDKRSSENGEKAMQQPISEVISGLKIKGRYFDFIHKQ